MKLEFEYEGKRYRFKDGGESLISTITDSDGNFCKPLHEKYCEFASEEEKKHEMDYWWESQISLAKRAMEKAGAKIIEFEDKNYDMVDKNGRPIIF